jgi:hypothetical protein
MVEKTEKMSDIYGVTENRYALALELNANIGNDPFFSTPVTLENILPFHNSLSTTIEVLAIKLLL